MGIKDFCVGLIHGFSLQPLSTLDLCEQDEDEMLFRLLTRSPTVPGKSALPKAPDSSFEPYP